MLQHPLFAAVWFSHMSVVLTKSLPDPGPRPHFKMHIRHTAISNSIIGHHHHHGRNVLESRTITCLYRKFCQVCSSAQ